MLSIHKLLSPKKTIECRSPEIWYSESPLYRGWLSVEAGHKFLRANIFFHRNFQFPFPKMAIIIGYFSLILGKALILLQLDFETIMRSPFFQTLMALPSVLLVMGTSFSLSSDVLQSLNHIDLFLQCLLGAHIIFYIFSDHSGYLFQPKIFNAIPFSSLFWLIIIIFNQIERGEIIIPLF